MDRNFNIENHEIISKKIYRDHYNDPAHDESICCTSSIFPKKGVRGGVAKPFPAKLYEMLSLVEDEGIPDVISWQPHGRSFIIHDSQKFVEEVMPRYFKQSKLASFQRQLNLYDFSRLTTGPDRGGYYHEFFLRGRPDLCKHIVRRAIKGTKSEVISPTTRPNIFVSNVSRGTMKCGQEALTYSFLNFLEHWENDIAAKEIVLQSDKVTELMRLLEPTPFREPSNLSSPPSVNSQAYQSTNSSLNLPQNYF